MGHINYERDIVPSKKNLVTWSKHQDKQFLRFAMTRPRQDKIKNSWSCLGLSTGGKSDRDHSYLKFSLSKTSHQRQSHSLMRILLTRAPNAIHARLRLFALALQLAWIKSSPPASSPRRNLS